MDNNITNNNNTNTNSNGATELSWLDFILDRSLLVQHLNKTSPDPTATTLITQFLVNADKWTDLPPPPSPAEAPPSNSSSNNNNGTSSSSHSNSNTPTPSDGGSDSFVKTSRQLKNRTLKLMAVQTAAHLNWDLDILAKLQIGLQNFLMNHILALTQEADEENNFLQCLYHRWVLRTIQTNRVTRVHYRPNNPMALQQSDLIQIADSIVKTFNLDRSLDFLECTIETIEGKNSLKILVPSVETFAGLEPNWSVGDEISAQDFESMIHMDLGIYYLYEGRREDARNCFKAQKLQPDTFPYYKISEGALQGYLASVGLTDALPKSHNTPHLPNLIHRHTVDISKWLQKGDHGKIEKIFERIKQAEAGRSNDVEMKEVKKEKTKGKAKAEKKGVKVVENQDEEDEELLPLDFSKIPEDPEPLVGQAQLEMFSCQRKLLETSDVKQIKDMVVRLSQLSMGVAIIPKLFMDWELPVPLQHATTKLPTGALRDFVHVLIAKSKQHYNLKNYVQARKYLHIAKNELDESVKQSINSWGFTQYNIRKLSQMLDWEILLIDISDLFSTWIGNIIPNGPFVDMVERCKECLRFLEDPSSEVNPRSEIVEFVLIALINLGDYKYVIKFEEAQKRWPFVEFLGLLARACRDVNDKKDASPNYRELWSSVLPVCMNTTGNKPTRPGKEGILSNRSSLLWILDRSCSLTLITILVSLLSRLHNHILDDVGLQINTELLHVWPNIIDDVTMGGSMEMKSRISGSSKLNIHQVQDFLFHLLDLAMVRSEETLWLKCLGDVHLASGGPALAMKAYVEYLAISTDYFELTVSPVWADNFLFRKMIKCCEGLQCFTQAMILCQFLSDVDYNVAFGMAQEKFTLDASDSLYGFVWDLTMLEYLVNLHTKRNESKKRQEAIRLLGLLELNSNNNEEIQRETMTLRKCQFLRTLAKMYIFV